MAKRILRIQHQDEIRAKIKGSQLTNLVQAYALTGKYNGNPVEPKRIDAALGLLKKLAPDLASVDSNVTVQSSFIDALKRIEQADNTQSDHAQPQSTDTPHVTH